MSITITPKQQASMDRASVKVAALTAANEAAWAAVWRTDGRAEGNYTVESGRLLVAAHATAGSLRRAVAHARRLHRKVHGLPA